MSGKANIVVLVVAGLLSGCAAPQAMYTRYIPRTRPGIPEQHGTAFNRAVEMVMRFEYAPAAEEFRRLEAVFSEAGAPRRTAEAVFWQGFCHEKLGNTEQAKQLYRRCYEIDRTTPAARQAVRRYARIQSAQESVNTGMNE